MRLSFLPTAFASPRLSTERAARKPTFRAAALVGACLGLAGLSTSGCNDSVHGAANPGAGDDDASAQATDDGGDVTPGTDGGQNPLMSCMPNLQDLVGCACDASGSQRGCYPSKIGAFLAR